jgi:hypothetical protein
MTAFADHYPLRPSNHEHDDGDDDDDIATPADISVNTKYIGWRALRQDKEETGMVRMLGVGALHGVMGSHYENRTSSVNQGIGLIVVSVRSALMYNLRSDVHQSHVDHGDIHTWLHQSIQRLDNYDDEKYSSDAVALPFPHHRVDHEDDTTSMIQPRFHAATCVWHNRLVMISGSIAGITPLDLSHTPGSTQKNESLTSVEYFDGIPTPPLGKSTKGGLQWKLMPSTNNVHVDGVAVSWKGDNISASLPSCCCCDLNVVSNR